jgi:hypothetical protein
MLKKITITAILVLLLAASAAAAAENAQPVKFVPTDPIMPVSEIKPGMVGTLKTVVKGTKVEGFKVSIVGVETRKVVPERLVVIRLEDKRLIEMGGLVAGMSGSPVYIDGKLAGAYSYGWNFGDPKLGLITPIEDMIKVFENPERIPKFGVAEKVPEKPFILDRREPADVLSRDKKASSGDMELDAESEEADSEDLEEEMSEGKKALLKIGVEESSDDLEEEDDDSYSPDIVLKKDRAPRFGSLDVDALREDVELSGSDLYGESGDKEAESADEGEDGESGDKELTPVPSDLSALSGAELKPLATPLQASGISARMAERISKKLNRTVSPHSLSNTGGVNLNAKLEPGSAVGVTLAWGDVCIGGTGTLTAIDKEGRFIAFGHPMFNFGSTALPLHAADVVQVIPSLDSPFKLANIGEIIGTVTQDRPAAIAGYIGQLVPATSYKINFHDIDRNIKTVKRFQTVADPFIGNNFGTVAMLGVVENLWARMGAGTAMVKFRVSGGNLAEGWERRNTYFSRDDLVSELAEEFDYLSEIFALNHFQEIRPLGVELSVEMTQEPRIVFIEKLEVRDKKDSYAPGDELEVDVTLRPWRKRAVVKTVKLTVPEHSVGFCEIVARAGGIDEMQHESLLEGYRAITSLPLLMQELDSEESFNQIIIEIDGPDAPNEEEGAEEGAADEAAEDGGNKGGLGKGRGKTEEEEEVFEMPSPEDFQDDRLKSEIKAERMKKNHMVVFDTNYYTEGKLKIYIKVKRADMENVLMQLFGKEDV